MRRSRAIPLRSTISGTLNGIIHIGEGGFGFGGTISVINESGGVIGELWADGVEGITVSNKAGGSLGHVELFNDFTTTGPTLVHANDTTNSTDTRQAR